MFSFLEYLVLFLTVATQMSQLNAKFLTPRQMQEYNAYEKYVTT